MRAVQRWADSISDINIRTTAKKCLSGNHVERVSMGSVSAMLMPREAVIIAGNSSKEKRPALEATGTPSSVLISTDAVITAKNDAKGKHEPRVTIGRVPSILTSLSAAETLRDGMERFAKYWESGSRPDGERAAELFRNAWDQGAAKAAH